MLFGVFCFYGSTTTTTTANEMEIQDITVVLIMSGTTTIPRETGLCNKNNNNSTNLHANLHNLYTSMHQQHNNNNNDKPPSTITINFMIFYYYFVIIAMMRFTSAMHPFSFAATTRHHSHAHIYL